MVEQIVLELGMGLIGGGGIVGYALRRAREAARVLRVKQAQKESQAMLEDSRRKARVRAVYVDKNKLLCIMCEAEFDGPLASPLDQAAPNQGCPLCGKAEYVEPAVGLSAMPTPEALRLAEDVYCLRHDKRTRDGLIDLLDNDKRYYGLTPDDRLLLARTIFRMWQSSSDDKLRDCLLNVYDNNTRQCNQTPQERQEVRHMVEQMADLGDRKARHALANQRGR